MTLNGTLLIQGINFIIAYFIIDRLLLRKAVKQIQEEQRRQETLMKDIQIERDQVATQEEQKKVEWQNFRLQFEKKSPSLIERPSFKEFTKKPKLPEELTETEIAQTAQHLEKLIIKKVSDVGT